MPNDFQDQTATIHQTARQAQDEARRPGPTIDLAMTWAGALPMLLAVLRDGMPEGQRQAEAELLRMARAADQAASLAAAKQAPVDFPTEDDQDAEAEPMDAAERHQAEQDELTALCEAGECGHAHCQEENRIVSRAAPAWAWETIDQTLEADAHSRAFDQDLRESIRRAHVAVILASELADEEPISEDDPRLSDEP